MKIFQSLIITYYYYCCCCCRHFLIEDRPSLSWVGRLELPRLDDGLIWFLIFRLRFVPSKFWFLVPGDHLDRSRTVRFTFSFAADDDKTFSKIFAFCQVLNFLLPSLTSDNSWEAKNNFLREAEERLSERKSYRQLFINGFSSTKSPTKTKT